MTRFSPAANLLPTVLGDIRMAQWIYGQWTNNGRSCTQVPQECLDRILQWRAWFDRPDPLDGSQPLADQFNELAAWRRLVIGHKASEAEKQTIIPPVKQCLGQFSAAVEEMLQGIAG